MYMHRSQLFDRPRLQLTILYSSVIGSILLAVGVISHIVIQRTFNRIVDNELHLLSNVLSSKLETTLQQPGKLSSRANQEIPELCLVGQSCQNISKASKLHDLIQTGYHLQLLDLKGQPLAAIIEPPDQFPANPGLITSQTLQNKKGEAFHLHLMPLKTAKGELWGYLQVGKSVQRLDAYMNTLYWLLLLGIPSTVLLIGWASWRLAGSAMGPIYQSYERMQQFTADVAHELKTPLATTQAIVETALDDPQLSLTDSQQALQSLHRQTQRLHQLVQDLLMLTRLDYQSSAQQNQTVCLNDLVEDVEEELAALAIAAKINLSCAIRTQSQIEIQGNSHQLYRLVSNLVVNGINYTKENGVVIIILEKTTNKAVIQVQDTGIGIESENLSRLFDRFYRVNQDRARATGGSGLGLAIVWAIAQAHGGSVEVSSQLGKGSLFTVSLPLK
jgi:signal transduction histidine kinase